MSAPVCRLCGVAHWAGAAHQFAGKAEPVAPVKASEVAANPSNGFDRKQYQRDYMRAYMAKKRAVDKGKAKALADAPQGEG